MSYSEAFKKADEILESCKVYTSKRGYHYQLEGIKQAFNSITVGITEAKLMPDDYFLLPASIRFHGDYNGGLFLHSYEMARALCTYTDALGLKWQRAESPLIIGLFHDLCKMEFYEPSRTDEIDGDKIYCFSYSNAELMPDHGAQSVIIAQQLGYELTAEEIACIRWHMGAFEKDPSLWKYYTKNIQRYPNVLYTHTADMAAAYIRNV